jgi:predicted dehydrogenase
VAVCGREPERTRAFADAEEIRTVCCSVDDLVAVDALDLVIVCTPPLLHESMNRTVLDAGLHAFSTKPIAGNTAAAIELDTLAQRGGRVTAMDLDQRYRPERRYFRHLVRTGYLGETRCVLATVFWGLATDPTTRIHYHGWTSLRGEGGGIIGASLMLHHLDLLRYTFGELHEASGVATTMIREKPVLAPEITEWSGLSQSSPTVGVRAVDAEDTVAVYAELDSGGIACLVGSWSIHNGSGIRVEAYGSEGTLVLDEHGTLRGARAGAAGLEKLPVPGDFGGAAAGTSAVDRFRLLFHDVADAMDAASNGDEPRPHAFATFHDGRRLREIADVVLAASSRHERVS